MINRASPQQESSACVNIRTALVPAGRADTDDHDTAELTAQAVHLRRLAARLDQLASHHDQLRDDLEGLTAIATEMRDTLSDGPREHLGPPCWTTMTATQAALAWRQLADWINDTFVPWYGITRDQLPDCWALHQPVLSELSWLHHAHRAAHQPGAPAHLAADWHTQWRPAVLRTIAHVVPRRGRRTCSPGRHLSDGTAPVPQSTRAAPAHPGEYDPPGEQLAVRRYWNDRFNQAMTEDLARRNC